MGEKKPRRYTINDITNALACADIDEDQRQKVLEILDSKPNGRPLIDDSTLLDSVAGLVLEDHLKPFSAAGKIAPDLKTQKRIHRKYLAGQAEIEEQYRFKKELFEVMKSRTEEMEEIQRGLEKLDAYVESLPKP